MEPPTSHNGNGRAAAGLRLVTGGAEIVAHFQGEPGEARSDLVRIREVPIRSMERYLALMSDEEKLIELFCNKPEGWAATLTPSSHTEIIEKGEEINDPLFDAWYQRRLNRIERLNPGFKANLVNTVMQGANEAAAQSAAASASNSSVSPSPAGKA